MAEKDTKTKEKPKSRGAMLYDNERSKKARGDTEPDEVQKAKAAAKGADDAVEEGAEKKAETAESKGLSKVTSQAEKMMEGLKALNKTHETERRDHHGNHREALRQMAARHEKGIKEFMEPQASGLTGTPVEPPSNAQGIETAAAGPAPNPEA